MGQASYNKHTIYKFKEIPYFVNGNDKPPINSSELKMYDEKMIIEQFPCYLIRPN